jgi:hypothetical protein
LTGFMDLTLFLMFCYCVYFKIRLVFVLNYWVEAFAHWAYSGESLKFILFELFILVCCINSQMANYGYSKW